MSGDEPSFTSLMEQVELGSEDAVRQLLDQYGEHVYRVIRRRLARRLRRQFDSDDFYQAVWASFFARRDLIARLETPEQLCAFLRTMAGNKVIDEVRRRLIGQKHNMNREQSLDAKRSHDALPLVSRDPRPSQVAVAQETMAQLAGNQPPQYRRILQMKLDGQTHEQIARRMGVAVKTVQRVLKRLARRLES